MADTTAGRPSGTWLGFLLMAFAIVGMMGLFATFAAPLPLQRAVQREAALDEAAAAAHGPDAAAALERLRPALNESAAAVLPLAPDIDQRIAAERIAMRARLVAEAGAVALRLRWLVCVVTVMAGAFGAACYYAGRRAGD